jgi:hypothetical protein
MADKKYEIQIDTKSDTSGAKKAEDALHKVEQAGKKAESSFNPNNPMALPPGYSPKMLESPEDIEAKAAAEKRLADYVAEREEKQLKLNKAIEEENEARRRLNDRQATARQAIADTEAAEQALSRATAVRAAAWTASGAAIIAVAKASLDRVHELGSAMSSLDPEWAQDNALWLKAIADLKDPIGTFWRVMTDGAEDSVMALAASQQQAKLMKARLDEMTAAQQRADRAFQASSIENTLKREKQAADALVASLERRHKLAQAKAAVEAANDQAAIAQARATGGDLGAAQGTAASNAATRKNAEIDRQLEAANAKVEQAVTAAQQAASAAAALGLAVGQNDEQFKKAAAKADDLQHEAEEARADLENFKAISEQNRQVIIAEINVKQAEITAAVRDQVTSNASDVLQLIDSKGKEIAEMPKQIRDTVNLAYASIQQKLADAIPDDRQQGEINAQLAALAAALANRDRALSDQIQDMVSQVNAAIRTLQNQRPTIMAPLPSR